MKKTISRFLLFFTLAAIALIFNRLGILQRTLDWIQSFGPAGPAIFVFVQALACVFFVPSFIFTFSGGVLFGLWKGFFLSAAGTILGSMAAFWIGRYLAHGWVEKRFSDNPEFQKLARAIKKKGWKVIVLARFSPIFPFLVGNYAFGVTRIHAGHYALATAIGTIPSSLLYAYLGFLTGDLSSFHAAGRARTPQEWLLLGFGLGATVFLGWYLRRLAEQDIES